MDVEGTVEAWSRAGSDTVGAYLRVNEPLVCGSVVVIVAGESGGRSAVAELRFWS